MNEDERGATLLEAPSEICTEAFHPALRTWFIGDFLVARPQISKRMNERDQPVGMPTRPIE